MSMTTQQYGDPIITVRIPSGMIVAAKEAARIHGTTLSELIRDLIAQQIARDGLTWQTVAPIDGQEQMDIA